MINKGNIKYLVAIIIVGALAWYQTLSFWFFKAYEATWLSGIAPYNIVNLIKAHAFLYFLDWKLFGWNPWGWYATSLVFHLLASILLFSFIFLISKNKILSFISSLIFVANTSYNDVLTWGSFNSYYPLLLIWMLSLLITFIKYKETGKLYFLTLSVAFAVLGFFTRETGIIIVPLLTTYDLIFSKNLKEKKNILNILKRQAPFYFALIGFFIIRSFYGGTIGDTADSNVKLQMKFVQDGLYVEYAKTAFLTFGKLIPPQLIPYPILNFSREYLSRFVYFEFINTYYFSILGLILFAGFWAIWLKLRKSKEYAKIFLFFLVWLGTFSLFVSLVIPHTPEVLARAYEYNTMRYRYFAFIGTSILLASFLTIFFKKRSKIIMFLIVLVVIIVNLLMIWRIEQKVYAFAYKPQKEFYTAFKNYFPTLPKESVFYIYPHASGLGDYLLEWYLIKEQSYPNLVGQPFSVESQMIAVMDKIKKGKIKLSHVFFLDYDQKLGLLDKTSYVKNVLRSQKDYQINISNPKENYFTGELKGPPVELPYDLLMSLFFRHKDKFIGSQPDSSRLRALVDYSVERDGYLNSVSISTAYTASQRAGEPFFHTLPSHLIDGNIGSRSRWIADSWRPWVQVDLGKKEEIIGVVWGSQDGTRSPATYSFFASEDGKTWNKIKSVKNFNKAKSIDIFDKPIMARFIKMEIYTTSGGDFVLLDEFEVLNSNVNKILEFYKDREELLNDVFNIFNFVANQEDLDYMRDKGLTTHWARLAWETDTTTSIQNYQFLYFPYRIDASNQKIVLELPEMEIYSGAGEFFKKHITSISLDFGTIPFIINVGSLRLVPRINLK